MGQGTTRVTPATGSAARVQELGRETAAVRRELDGLVSELDRRRHLAFDWRRQLRRHGRAVALVSTGIVAIAGLIAVTSIARRRRHQGLASRLSELADAMPRALRTLGDAAERLAAAQASIAD